MERHLRQSDREIFSEKLPIHRWNKSTCLVTLYRDDSDPRSRLIAARRPKEGLLLVSVKSNIHRILINDFDPITRWPEFQSPDENTDA